jgi:radical SAM superfamily enzyme YgiQ (UPF0313 family)
MNLMTLDARSLLSKGNEIPLIESKLDRLFPKRSIQNVLFVVPPDGDAKNFNYTTCKLGRYPNFPPYGVGILAARLRQLAVHVDVLNLNNEVLKAGRASKSDDDFDFDQVVDNLLKRRLHYFKPDLVGVTCMFSQTHESTIGICKKVKHFEAKLPVAAGGVHITNSMIDEKTHDLLFKSLSMVDLFFAYESDLSFPNFVKIVNKKEPLTSLSQVFINDEKVPMHFINRVTPKGDELDVIPAHDLITEPDLAENGKIGSYHMHAKPGARFATALSNRGCRAQCTFCSVRNFNGSGVRTRSVQSVIDELLMLRHEHGVGHVMWLDDDFLKDHDRTLKLFNEMVRQDVGITWDCTNGVIAYSCTEEIIAAAVASGCVGLTIGMESGNPEILKEVKKPGTVDVFLKAAEVFRKFEQLNSRVFLMVGFPHETFGMVRDTFDIAKKMNMDWSFITPLQPLPNTPIFAQMALEGMIGSVVFEEIRYKLGAHGNQRKMTERKINVFATDFNPIFEISDPEAIPSKDEINRLWAYMNYHLNFAPLLKEKRVTKHQQMFQYLKFIADVVAPDDAFAHYFRAYLHYKLHGNVDQAWIDRLIKILKETPEWQDRFQEFHLSVDDLKTLRFPEGTATSGDADRRKIA